MVVTPPVASTCTLSSSPTSVSVHSTPARRLQPRLPAMSHQAGRPMTHLAAWDETPEGTCASHRSWAESATQPLSQTHSNPSPHMLTATQCFGACRAGDEVHTLIFRVHSTGKHPQVIKVVLFAKAVETKHSSQTNAGGTIRCMGEPCLPCCSCTSAPHNTPSLPAAAMRPCQAQAPTPQDDPRVSQTRRPEPLQGPTVTQAPPAGGVPETATVPGWSVYSRSALPSRPLPRGGGSG